MEKITKTLIAAVALALFGLAADADDQKANELAARAAGLAARGSHKSAAEYYLDARFYADDHTLKANSLKLAAGNFATAGYLHREFECLEELMESYPDHVDFKTTIERQFAIGDAFYAGHRDPAFVWIPWFVGDNHAITAYEKALRRGPFSPKAAEVRLRLGRLYIEDNQIIKGLESLRETVALHPGSEVERFARLELANSLVQLAEANDGDGKYGREAEEVLAQFVEKFPDDSEAAWARDKRELVRRINARRLLNLARYYTRQNNERAAQRYLNEVLVNYYDTNVAADSEGLLASIDADFQPSDKVFEEPRHVQFETRPLPAAPEKILVVPENSDGRWLLPIREISVEKREEETRMGVEQRVKRLLEW